MGRGWVLLLEGAMIKTMCAHVCVCLACVYIRLRTYTLLKYNTEQNA